MSSLIYDWNGVDDRPRPARLLLDDETLRDGLQSPSVRCPAIEQKIELLHLMEGLGMDSADIGLPGAGPHVARDVERLAQEIVSAKLRIRPNCAARTVIADIRPIAEISQRVGMPIEVAAFIGSSHIRQYVEDWTLDFLERCTDTAVSFATREGLPVVYVTEDTTRAHPDTLRRLYLTALGIGERTGNTPMDLLLINLVLMGYLQRDLSTLGRYCQLVSESCGVEIPHNYPVFGRDAFRTQTGVHAAAVAKAFHKQDRQLADAVYSAIPASLVGREQEIEVGPMSGRSNVVFWLERRGHRFDEAAVDRIFEAAKHSATVLTEEQILALLRAGADSSARTD